MKKSKLYFCPKLKNMTHTLLNDLYPKDLITVCRADPEYHTICSDESFWKKRVYNDYDIDYIAQESWKTLYYDLTYKKARIFSIELNKKSLGQAYHYQNQKLPDSISLFLKAKLNKTISDFSGLLLLMNKKNAVLSVQDLSFNNKISAQVAQFDQDQVKKVDIITEKGLIDNVLSQLP